MRWKQKYLNIDSWKTQLLRQKKTNKTYETLKVWSPNECKGKEYLNKYSV